MKRLGKIKTLAAASLAAFAVAAPVALAQTGGQEGTERPRAERRGGRDGHRGGGRHGGFGRGFGFRGIELTDDQKTRLQALRQSFGERTRPLREQLRAKHQELRAAQDGTTFNEALASQKLSEAAAIQARLMGEEFRLRQESLAVLTAEQRTQLEQQRNERKQRREQRRNRGEGRGTTEMF
jgi:Spy/CpxP family protein refolding chaperone